MNDELSLKAQEAVAEDLQANKATQFNSAESGKQEEDKKSPNMGQEWGFVNTDYFLEGADQTFGEGYSNITAAGVVAAAEMGVDIWALGKQEPDSTSSQTSSQEQTETEPLSARQRLEEMRQNAFQQQPKELGSARQRLNEMMKQQAETDNQDRTHDLDIDR